MIIGLDFDGTCVTHEYPNIGRDIGAIPVLQGLVARGDKIILFTMRSGEQLQAAQDWLTGHGIPLFGVNQNPEQHTWTSSPKPYCHVYIDDAAAGCPLIHPDSGRPYVNWSAMAKLLGV